MKEYCCAYGYIEGTNITLANYIVTLDHKWGANDVTDVAEGIAKIKHLSHAPVILSIYELEPKEKDNQVTG